MYNNIEEDLSDVKPLVPIVVNNHHGCAFLDTGAKCSVAGASLAKLLYKDKIPFSEDTLVMTLADGVRRKVKAHIFMVDVILQDKLVPTRFVSVPEHEESRTLLGLDFIKASNVILNIPENKYYFGENLDVFYEFSIDLDVTHVVNNICFESIKLRDNEGLSLDQDQRNQLDSLLTKHGSIFKQSTEPTPYAEHTIVLLDETPIAVPPYRMSEPKKELLRKELDKLLDLDYIEECESPYASPVVLVPKKDNGVRLTVDYRALNAVTRADRYPIPRIDDLLHAAKETKFMTTLDLQNGYHLISVKPSDRDKTAFVNPFGTFRYKRMPFGVRNGPSTFQRLIDRFKSGLQDVFILAYLDDIIIISSSFSEHLADLGKVFQRLNLFKLTLNRKKCSFACDSVSYLGHVITVGGIRPNEDKVAAILKMSYPNNVKQLLSFLQTCSWFRRFIENFAQVSKPLSMLTRKNVKWKWEQEQIDAFNRLKELLCTSPILRQADHRLPYILRTDASSYAIGACLLQGEREDERPVEYASRLLTSAEQNYNTTEREALAVVWAVKKFRGYLEGATTIIQSDHQPLKWLMSLKSPTGRLARWALELMPFDLQIDYITGKRNVIADTLSRPPVNVNPTTENTDVNYISADFPTLSLADIRSEQLSDPDISKIISTFENPNEINVDFKKWTERGYTMSKGVLYRYNPDMDEDEPQLVVAQCRIPHILQQYHDASTAGHYGIEKTYQRIARRYYWTGMRKRITDHLSKCIECQRFKVTNLKPAGLLQTPIQSQRFEVLSMDLFGPLPATSEGYTWVFVVEDVSSRWTELFPLVSATAVACARCLIDEIILRYGAPRRVISDNGTQFVGSVMQHVAHILGFQQSLIPVYHPASNPVERKNRDLKTQLGILTQDDHTAWSDKLPSIRFAMNTAKCASTGFTPAYLTFARELRTPDDSNRDFRAITHSENFVAEITPYLVTMSKTLSEARETHEHSQDKRNVYANLRVRDVTLSIGDKVLVTSHVLSNAANTVTSKFIPRRDGPYVVTNIISPTSYEISSLDETAAPVGKYHISALTPYHADSDKDDPQPSRPIRKRGRPPKKKMTSETTVATT